ncbi:hypothetical protein V6N13_025011 [Hibiscus sabdariffa]
MERNPTVANVQRVYENLGGRPPEGVLVIAIVPARERKASPSPLDRERSLKKGCSEDPREVHGSVSNMDAEGGSVSTAVEDMLNTSGHTAHNNSLSDPLDKVKDSYASKVMGSKRVRDRVDTTATLNDGDVVILDEDMVVDDHRRKIGLARDSGISRPGGQSESRFELLRTDEVNNDEHTHAEVGVTGKSSSSGSKLVNVPSNDEGEGHAKVVVRNVAYMESNSVKKNKANKKGRKAPTVVPLIDGQDMQVVDHTLDIILGNHSAVKIFEQGEQRQTTSVTTGVHGRNLHRKSVLEPTRRGVRIRKRAYSHIMSKMSHLELVKDISDQITGSCDVDLYFLAKVQVYIVVKL